MKGITDMKSENKDFLDARESDMNEMEVKKEKIECIEAHQQPERENDWILRQQFFDAHESDINIKTAALEITLRKNKNYQMVRFETAAKNQSGGCSQVA
jgi:uncharacterized membrane protein